MEILEHRCQRCGGELSVTDGGRMKCIYCGCVYDRAVAERNTRDLKEAFDEVKREIICNLRRNLYDAVNEEYISSEKVRECAAELKKYLPTDFAACFYEVAVGNNIRQITRHIRKINVEENYSEIDGVVRFLIKSLQTEYLLELNNLVERAYKMRDLALFERYSTEISIEAEKVESGVYETKMPREVFIAYSSKDMDTVSELCEVLEAQGLKCFVAARNLRHGKGSVENYDRLLEDAMDHCKSFVFVSSANSRNFSCDALTKELPYIQNKDIENAPAEHKNNYATMPHQLKKPRVEYRIEESRRFNAADAISNEFFDGYERVYSPEAVAERVVLQLVSAAEKAPEMKQEKKAVPTPEPVISQAAFAPAFVNNTNVEPILKRAAIFADDGDWESTYNYCEKALDIDPENAKAYILKLMIDLKVRTQDELVNCAEPFDNNGNFKKAVKFGDEETANRLKGYIIAINERNEAMRKDEIYSAAIHLMSINDYNSAFSKFGEIPSWKDAKDKMEQCRKVIIQKQIEANDCIYRLALNLMSSNDISDVKDALEKFEGIRDWKDADVKIKECEAKIAELKIKAEKERLENIRILKEKRKNLKRVSFGIASLTIIISVILLFNSVIIPNAKYNKAVALMDSGNYTEAISMFNDIDDLEYKDVEEKIAYCNLALGNYEYFRNYIQANNIQKVVIPNGVKNIASGAFIDCKSLETVVIPDSVTSIGDDAFYGCSSLMGVDIPDSVTSVGDYAFYGYTSLRSVVIPDSVTNIGDYAFRGCDSLTSVTFKNPNGWWYASSSGATSGTSISSSDLANASTAATYLTEKYRGYYWRRN